MNRKIKFRVWDNVDYMTLPFTLEHLQTGRVKFTNDCIVMQFTGLKDKNGQEIYEGDIVKEGYENFAIEYYKGMFIQINKNYPLPGLRIQECEIIGNIYENPELLK